jgi:hypothetical protein
VWAENHAGKLFAMCGLSADTTGSADFKWRLFFLYRLDFVIPYYIYSMVCTVILVLFLVAFPSFAIHFRHNWDIHMYVLYCDSRTVHSRFPIVFNSFQTYCSFPTVSILFLFEKFASEYPLNTKVSRCNSSQGGGTGLVCRS